MYVRLFPTIFLCPGSVAVLMTVSAIREWSLHVAMDFMAVWLPENMSTLALSKLLIIFNKNSNDFRSEGTVVIWDSVK